MGSNTNLSVNRTNALANCATKTFMLIHRKLQHFPFIFIFYITPGLPQRPSSIKIKAHVQDKNDLLSKFAHRSSWIRLWNIMIERVIMVWIHTNLSKCAWTDMFYCTNCKDTLIYVYAMNITAINIEWYVFLCVIIWTINWSFSARVKADMLDSK